MIKKLAICKLAKHQLNKLSGLQQTVCQRRFALTYIAARHKLVRANPMILLLMREIRPTKMAVEYL